MDELEKFLKELGVDEPTIKKFKKTQEKYKEYFSDIRKFNASVIHTPTAPPIYDKNTIEQRQRITRESAKEIISNLEEKQRNEVEAYEQYKVTSTFINNLNETDKILKTLGQDIRLPNDWLEQILELLENAEKEDAEYFAYTINRHADELITTYYKYNSAFDDLQHFMEFENALSSAVEYFIETIQMYI